jgi:peptidoglycan/xylan/chitin deacetylase (PgdA/CDA1 family)
MGSVAMFLRLLPQKRKSVLLSILLLAAGVGYVRYLYRSIPPRKFINPLYWLARARGEDCFDARNAILRQGNTALPEVALTFDDGPHRESRAQILDTLQRYGAKATFFDVGRRMAENPDLLLRSIAEGHEIANHSANHIRLPALAPDVRHREINDADITYCRLTGKHLTLFRPPGMRYNTQVTADLKRLGYILVSYTVAVGDYGNSESPSQIAADTLHRIYPGDILLLHDYPATAAALPEILENLQKRGLRCVTISEMLAHLPERPRLAARNYLQNHPERRPPPAPEILSDHRQK